MLDESEWEQIFPDLQRGFQEVKEYRRAHRTSFEEAKQHVYGHGALKRYFEMTGFHETNFAALWHHRLSRYGPPCRACGKPLRTPRAKLCAACGAEV